MAVSLKSAAQVGHIRESAQYVGRVGNARVPQSHLEPFGGEDFQLGRWVNHRRRDFKVGRLSSDRVAALEAFPGWVWEAHEANFQEGLEVLAQYVERVGNARVADRFVEPFGGEDFSLGQWASRRRRQFRVGRLSSDRVVALEAFPGWEWNPPMGRRKS